MSRTTTSVVYYVCRPDGTRLRCYGERGHVKNALTQSHPWSRERTFPTGWTLEKVEREVKETSLEREDGATFEAETFAEHEVRTQEAEAKRLEQRAAKLQAEAARVRRP